jgi:hypothetical protein
LAIIKIQQKRPPYGGFHQAHPDRFYAVTDRRPRAERNPA